MAGVRHQSGEAFELPTANWRFVVACGGLATMLFTVLAIPLGGAFTLTRFAGTLRTQALTWGLWVVLVPFVLMAARRAHRAGVASPRGLAIHVAAGVALTLVHATAFGALRWTLGLATSGTVSGVVAATVAFVVGGDFLRYMLIVAAYHAVAFASEARQRAVGEANMARALAEARLAALEQRLHPHFLFNTLNAIAAQIHTSPRAAQRMVEQLGELLRAALNAEPGREVPLADELQFLERYTAIELERFPDRLQVLVLAGPEELGALVPQMLLQPLVENAIRHGLAPRDGPGTVVVSAERRGETLRLSVRDDGEGMQSSQLTMLQPGRANGHGTRPAAPDAVGPPRMGGFGVAHTRERLAALYGTDFTMDLAPNAPTGTVVTIDIPFRTSETRSVDDAPFARANA